MNIYNIEDIYHNYLESKNIENRKKYDEHVGWFSASSAGSCFKKNLLRAEGKEGPPFEPRVMRLLRLGTIVHEDIQKAILNQLRETEEDWESKYTVFIEKRIEDKDLNLVGHLDLAIWNEKTRFLKVYDIKTCAGYKWKMMFGRKASVRNANHSGSSNYKLQLGTYAGSLANELGPDEIEMSLLWYNKDTSAMREQLVDITWMNRALEYWTEINEQVEEIKFRGATTDDLRPGIYGVPMESWECKYCSYYKIYCEGVK